jgi:hypothetical protein
MYRRKPEHQSVPVDVKTSRREVLSPLHTQKRTTFVRNDGEAHAIELNERDDMVVVLERGGPDYAEGTVLISDTNTQTGTAFTIWRNGDDEILFIDPVAIDPEPSAAEDFDKWEVVRQEEQEQASFTSQGFDITEDNGYIAGVDNGAPFALEFDTDNTPIKCHVWDDQKRKWCCLVQPLNPDYVTSLLNKATAISSAQSQLRDRLVGITVGNEEVKELNPVLARMKEEASRRNQGHKWGRELTAQLDEVARKEDNNLTRPPVWHMRGPEGLMEHLPRIKGELPGLKDMQFIWGTSFCRADIKEILQYLSLSKALEAEGKTGMKAAYFIDANAHTTGELLEATARDFNLDEQELIAILNLQPRPLPLEYADQHTPATMMQMSNNLHLPPAFYDAPDIGAFDSLQNANMGEVLDIWRAAALETKGQTFGDWRIAVDRLSIRRLAEKIGADPDFIQVVSMTDIIAAVPNMTTRHVTTAVEDMWTRIKPEVQKGLMGVANEDIDNDDMPMVFRLVLPDGRRIGINTQFRPIDLETREEVTDVPFAQEAAASIRRPLTPNQGLNAHTIQEAFSRYPMQFSGLGYYLFTKVMAESNMTAADYPRSNQISMIIDDYEQSVGPTAAGVALREKEAVLPLSMPKGLVGIRTARQIDFDTTPDVSTLLALPDSEMSQISTFIDSTAQTLRNDDIGSATGLVIDMRIGQVSEVTRIASRRQMLAISSIESNGVQPAPVNTEGMTYSQERVLPAAIMALRPHNVNTVLTGYIGSHENVTSGVQVLQSAQHIAEGLGTELPHTVSDYLSYLSNLDSLLTDGERIAEEIETVMTSEEWHAYWQNNIKSQAMAGMDTGLGIVQTAYSSVDTFEGARDYAQGLNRRYRTVAQEQIELELRAGRVDHAAEFNGHMQDANRLLQECQALQQYTGMLNRIGKQNITADELLRSINSNTNDFVIVARILDAYTAEKRLQLGSAGAKARITISEADITTMLEAARVRFTDAYSRASMIIPPEKPLTEILKASGRMNPDAKNHLDLMRERSLDSILMVNAGMSEEKVMAALKTGLSPDDRQQMKAEWEARKEALVQTKMQEFKGRQEQYWISLNQQTIIGGRRLQNQIETKQTLEDRIHFGVIQPRGEIEAQMKQIHERTQREYQTWWNSVAKGLLKQGFPVSGNAN